ncbi:MAG: hypothetical protein J6B95_02800 [Oscillospiraceae bacterium]|nr:hypothetical protein [Oscillospiraceae bacterium]
MRRSKIMSILLSLAVAMGLWLYVITTVSPDSDETISGIPVIFEGETVLREERGMMITSDQDMTVSLHLSGNRSDLAKLDKSNITIKVDLTKIYDPGEHELVFSYSFPGDVPSSAITVESKNPSTIKVTVEERVKKEVPVNVTYIGSVPEGYLTDTENAVLDYPMINILGPSSVINQIDHARIDVDLNECTESISESYRYTLCDAEDNPVDVAQVTTDTAEVRLDLKIQRWVELKLELTVNYGGGATASTSFVDIVPQTIKVSGSDTVLDALGGKLHLGTINLAEINEDTEMTFEILLPEGVTNLTGVTDAAVGISFIGLGTREYTVSNIRSINVPEGMACDLMAEVIKITLRGPVNLINSLTEEDITLVVDCSGKEAGTSTMKATVEFSESAFDSIGVLGTVSVPVTLTVEEAA